MIDKQQWLTTTFYTEQDLFELEPPVNITHQMILDMPPEERPVDWFNPFELTEQQVDEMRVKFDGSSLKWVEYVKVYIPFLDPVEERQLKKDIKKQQDVAKCGHKATKINKMGLLVEYYPMCKHYDLCPRCREYREKDHFNRLMKLDGCPYIVGNRKETVAFYHAQGIQTYSYKVNGQDITVIDTPEKIEGASLMDYQTAKEHKGLQISGTKVSGEAGKSQVDEAKKESQRVDLLAMRLDVPPDTYKKIEQEYLEETQHLTPLTLENLIEYLKLCQAILFKVARRHCSKIQILGTYFLYVNEDDLSDWDKRFTWIKERLKVLNQ